MTATAPAPAAATRAAAPVPTSTRLTFARAVRSEAVKLFSLRSTWWSIAIAAVLSIGISLLMAAASAEFDAGFPAVAAIVMPMQFTMLVAGILGAIAITGEYSTGMIRSTFTAVPRRGEVLAAKAIVIGGFLAVASAVIFAVAIVVTAPVLASPIEWDDPAQSIIPLAYGVLSMTCFALIGLSFGFILRNGAGAIAATVGLLFIAPIVTELFRIFGESWQWIADLSQYLPMSASQVLTTPGVEDPTTSLISLLSWVVAGLLASWVILRVRDA